MKRVLPIILAIVLAVVAAGIVFFYTRGAEQRVLDEQQPVAVLVTTGVIPGGMPLGDAVAGGLVESTQVPSTMAPTGAITAVTAENTGLLALGTALASVMGTTGAAMLLIRPLLRANDNRAHRAHVVVFFIILVANVGGALTPLGEELAERLVDLMTWIVEHADGIVGTAASA